MTNYFHKDLESSYNRINEPFSPTYNHESIIGKLEISDIVKKQLLLLNAKCYLPRTNDRKKNRLNIYVNTATHIGGLERICYLKIETGCLEINEYRGSRGDRFSGYYHILLKRLQRQGIAIINKRSVILDISQINQLVECINQISESQLLATFTLEKTNTCFSRTVGKNTQQLPICYYREKEEFFHSEDITSVFAALDELIKKAHKICAESPWSSLSSFDEHLSSSKAALDEVLEIFHVRKSWIEVNSVSNKIV